MTINKKGIFQYPVIFSFLAIIASIEFIRMSLTMVLLPSFLTTLKYKTDAIGVIISAGLLADNLIKSATGWLVDHKGPWPLLFAGSIIVLAGTVIIISFPQQLWLLIIASVLIGVGVSPTWPGSISGSIQIIGEDKRATMISIISVVWMAGGGLGPFLMGFIIDSPLRRYLQKFHLPVTDAYRTGFIILVAIAVLAIVVCILGWINWRKVPHIQANIEKKDQTENKLELFKAVIRRLWQVKGLIPGMFLQALSLGMLIPNLLPYALNHLGLTEAQYSMLLLTGGIFVVVFMIPVGHLADHWGTKGFLVCGFTLAALALFALATYGNGRNVWIIVAVAGFSYSLIQPAWNALLAGAIPPNQRGVLMGLFMSVEGLGFAIGPALGGLLGTIKGSWFFGTVNANTPFYVSGAFLLLMGLVYLIYPFKMYKIEDL